METDLLAASAWIARAHPDDYSMIAGLATFDRASSREDGALRRDPARVRALAREVWTRWRREIDRGKHPSARRLGAYLRTFRAHVPGDVAAYVADRVEGVHPAPRGGRHPKRVGDRMKDQLAGMLAALDALWHAHHEGDEEAARSCGMHPVELRKARSRYRGFLEHGLLDLGPPDTWKPIELIAIERRIDKARTGAAASD